MSENRDGLKAAVDLLLQDDRGTDARRSEQLSLLPSPVIVDEVKRAGRGRPVGARNRKTEDMVAWIAARYRDPRVFLAETYNRPVEQLARELGVNKGEAFARQQAAAIALLPYVAQKQPMAVQISAEGEVQLIISTAPPSGLAAVAAGLVIEQEDEENQ